MSITINTKVFTADRVGVDSVTYAGPSQTVSIVDSLTFSRSLPKPTAVFSGVAKPNFKFSRTVNLAGALTPSAPLILNCGLSVPVGAASADIDAICADAGAFLSSAAGKDFVKKMLINY